MNRDQYNAYLVELDILVDTDPLKLLVEAQIMAKKLWEIGNFVEQYFDSTG